MTLHHFRFLMPDMQLLYVLEHGQHLAQRLGNQGPLYLYYLPDQQRGFFAEVGWDRVEMQTAVLRSFAEAEPLAAYAWFIKLPEA